MTDRQTDRQDRQTFELLEPAIRRQKELFSRENTPDIVTLGHDFLQNIWLPEFYIYDLKTFKVKKTLKVQDGIEIQKSNSNDIVIQYYIMCMH